MKIILDDKYCLNFKSGTTTIALSIRDALSRTVKDKETGEEEIVISDKDIRWFNNISDALNCYVKLASVEGRDEDVITLDDYFKMLEELVAQVSGVHTKFGDK